MPVNFNPNLTFTNQMQENQSVVSQKPEVAAAKPAESDSFKKSGSFKEDISNIAKFFATLSEMTKATVKAIGYGFGTVGAFLAGNWLFNVLPNGFKKGNSLKQAFTHPIKNIGRTGKIIAGLAGVSVAGYQIIKGKLIANQLTANIDHQLKTGHRTV